MTRAARIFLLWLVVAAFVASPTKAGGQAAASPLFTADIAPGLATGTGGEYRERTQFIWHTGANVRVAQFAYADLLLRVNGDATQHPGDYIAICQVGSHGQCLTSFPELRGGSVEMGMRGVLTQAITITGGAGVGVYHAKETGYGTASETSTAWTLSADAAVAVTRHVQLFLGGRRVSNVEIAGARVGFNAITFGLRGR